MTATNQQPTASACVRLSRTAGETNLSLAGMEQELHDLADRLGLRLIGMHVDDGISGAVRDRPAFTAWLDDARSGRADVLLANYTDRLTREGVNAAAMVLDVIEGKDPATGAVVRKPVRLVTADGLDSERDADAFRWRFVIAAEVARSERAAIVRRNKANKARMLAARRWAGGPRPYGYRPEVADDGKGKVLVPVPDEAAIVQRIAEEVIAGRSLYSIAGGLNEDGVPSAKGGTWSATTVTKLIRSEHILGRLSSRRRPVLDDDGVPIVAWTPLLDLETAERARGIVAPTPTPGRAEATSAGRRKKATRLLSGLLYCVCGASLVVRRRRGIAYYGCASIARGIPHDSPSLLVDAEKVEAEVTRQFLAVVGHWPVIEHVTRVPSIAGLAEAERDLANAQARISNTASADLPTLFAEIQSLSERRERLAAEPTEPVTETVVTDETYVDRWARSHVDDQRRMLADSGAVIDIAPAKRRGYWDPTRVTVTFVDTDEQRLRDYTG